MHVCPLNDANSATNAALKRRFAPTLHTEFFPLPLLFCRTCLKMVFSTEKLIELVKNYPIMYDLSHDDYKNVRKKDKVWDSIGLELRNRTKTLYHVNDKY